jgi:antirestriction protein ArdC
MMETVNDKALQRFAELMVDKIKEINDDYRTPWFSSVGHGLPQNLEGRVYNGINSFMLFLLQEKQQYHTPVYMTFLQAKEQGVKVNKGAVSFPVLYWNFSIKDDAGNKITMDEYKSLSKEEKEKYTVYPFTKVYPVFNVDQTNFAEVHPDKWKELQQKFHIAELKDEKGMLSSPEIDYMLKNEKWLCPISLTLSDNAFYRPSEDKIYVPLKGQFKDGESFYATLLHEMAHSTGVESRLGRDLKNVFGDPKYAKEELVAELTAAVACQSLGITSGIQEDNAKYLKNWLGAIKKEPKFLFSVLSDVGKASTMILNEVCKEQQKKIEQNEEKKEEKKEEKISEDKCRVCKDEELSPAFKVALAAAISGSFKAMADLKEQGYKPSSEDIKALKEAGPKVCIAAQTIFNIKSENAFAVASAPQNKKEDKQLTLNF